MTAAKPADPFSTLLTAQDVEFLRTTGRDPEKVSEELLKIGDPSLCRTVLARPALVGDGITILAESAFEDVEEAHRSAQAQARFSTFVPASGAATRMFLMASKALRRLKEPGSVELSDKEERQLQALIEHAHDLALWPALRQAGARAGDEPSILEALVGASGLNLHGEPKALVPFHWGEEGQPCTALTEQLHEAVSLCADADGRVEVHFTAPPTRVAEFENACAEHVREVETAHGVEISVSLSVQDPSTDTPVLRPDGRLCRTETGAPRLRPGGHGSLLRNLQDTGADLLLIKNIDNVVPYDQREDIILWRRRIAGSLALRQGQAWAWIGKLRAGEPVEEQAQQWIASVLGIQVEAERKALLSRLNRPWRVLGMVKRSGHSGGGPMWAHSPDGITLQVVEDVQIEHDDPLQAAVVAGSSHFNPVDVAIGLRDVDGQPFELSSFVDPAAAILTEKEVDGVRCRVYEHPGLWNGSMACWNTIFIDVPAHTFNPVKSVTDLLSPSHGWKGPTD